MIKVPNKRLQMVTYIYLMVFLRPPIAFYTSWLIDNAPDYQTMSQYVEQTQKEVDDVLTKLLHEASAKEEQHDWNTIAEHSLLPFYIEHLLFSRFMLLIFWII